MVERPYWDVAGGAWSLVNVQGAGLGKPTALAVKKCEGRIRKSLDAVSSD